MTPRADQAPSTGQQDQDVVSLDSLRDSFFVAHKSIDRFAKVVGDIAQKLQDSKADDPWLTEAQEGAARLVLFHGQQHQQWCVLSDTINSYLESVRDLAEKMAVNDLKGEATEEADLSENKAKKVHPELRKFQMEKQARILGKVGGVPALGGMKLPVLPRDQVLRATGGTAAREIHFSKMEGRDAPQLATVFQRKAAATEGATAEWQQEAMAKTVRRHTEAAAEELRRQEEQDEQLTKAGAAELAGLLRERQQALRSRAEEEEAAAASSYRRVEASGQTANAPLPVRELQEASPELASLLKARQEAAARAQRAQEEAEAEEAERAAADAPAWSNTAAPFGGELSALLQKRRESAEAKAAAAPVQSSSRGAVPLIGDAASSELAQRLQQRAHRLSREQEEQQQQE